MLAVPPGMRVWLAAGHTDMRRGINGLAAQVQQSLGRDPHAGDPRAWLADVLARIADMPQQRLHELLPWNWKKQQNMAPGTA
jgi:transposase